MDLSALQHERGHSQSQAWLDRWEELENDQAKVNFLLMLKGRRDQNNDASAGKVFFHLTTQWMHEEFVS